MLRPTQIIAIFGVFLSMFYIFKYGGTNPSYTKSLCHELIELRMETAALIIPLVSEDKTGQKFDEKMQKAVETAGSNPEFISRQLRIESIERRLDNKSCPAPNIAQMTRIVTGSS